MKIHIKIIAWINIVFSVLNIVSIVILHTLFLRLALSAGKSSKVILETLPAFYLEFLKASGLNIFILTFFIWGTASGLVFGYGMLRFKEWARRLGLVMVASAILYLAVTVAYKGFQVVDILSWIATPYMLWIMLARGTRELCRSQNQAGG